MRLAINQSLHFDADQNSYELVCKTSNNLCDVLREIYGDAATGHGLGQLTYSVRNQLPTWLRRVLLSVNRERNDVVHHDRILSNEEKLRFASQASAASVALARIYQRLNPVPRLVAADVEPCSAW